MRLSGLRLEEAATPVARGPASVNTVKRDADGTGFTVTAPLGTSMDGMGAVAVKDGDGMVASGAALCGTVKDGMVASGAALFKATPVNGPGPWVTGVTGMAGAWV